MMFPWLQLRVCVPRVQGRGAGLGNELVTWTKSFIAGQVLGIPSLHPAWGLNQRRYWRYFGTSRLDWIGHRLLCLLLPRHVFTEAAFIATGETDFGVALARWAAGLGLRRERCYVVVVEGMWGGLVALEQARAFALGRLYAARFSAPNLADLGRRVDRRALLVAVHVRLGDFSRPSGKVNYQGRFDVALPLDWVMRTCANLRRAFADRVQFLLLTDGSPQDVQAFIEMFDPLTNFHLRDTACSDLLCMASADAIVCSTSSFSMWGAFLSEAPYLWYAPNLQQEDGCWSLFGHEARQRAPAGLTYRNRVELDELAATDYADLPRGVPIAADGKLPPALIATLSLRLRLKSPRTDLVRYGVVPADSVRTD